MHFRTRHDVIVALLDRSPYRSLARAMTEGKVEFMGGFREAPPDSRPCWIIRVTSIYGRIWIMGVVPDEVRHSFIVRRLESIPWACWVGPTGNPLHDGDKPDEAIQLRTSALAETSSSGTD